MNLNNLFESDFNDKKRVNEVDPRNFDSDEDYYDAVEADDLDLDKFGNGWDIPDEIAVLRNQLRHTTSQYARDQIENKIKRYEDIYYGEDDLEEGVGSDMAKLGGIAALGVGGALVGNYSDTQQPKVEIGGQIAFVEPSHINVPDSAMTLTGKDGKTYRVWATKGTAQSSKRYHAVPVKQVKEQDVEETRVGNRMSDMVVGSPKVVYKNGKAVGEIGIDHDPSPGNGPYYMKHYETNTWYSGYPTKKEALEELKYVVQQMDEGVAEAKASTAAFRASNAKRAKLNAMTPEERKEYDKEQAEKQRKRDDARLEKERQKFAAKKKVSEADKKKDDAEPEVRDVALQRAISRAKADFPTAGTGIEALAKDFMRSQEQDQKSLDQIRDIDQQQDRMLKQIDSIDQQQNNEIAGLDQQNSSLIKRLQQLQSVNSQLEKKLAAMSGRKPSKTTTAEPAAPAPVEPVATAEKPKTKAKSKTKAVAPTSSMKSTATQLAAPKADPMAAMTNRITKGDAAIINPKQAALPFEPSDNVLEPTIPQRQQDPRFAAARRDASDVDPRYYADLTSQIAKKAIQDPETAMQTYRVHEGEDEEQEADYDDKYQSMVARVGQKAREQEKNKPVDIADLARRLAAIDASKKD